MDERKRHKDKLGQAAFDKTSFMSTAKWMHLFTILRATEVPCIAEVKLLLDDKLRSFSVPNESDFINDKYLEEYWGVFKLKEIEWISIPAVVYWERKNRDETLSPKIKYQDLQGLKELLDSSSKKMEYNISEKELIIFGYR